MWIIPQSIRVTVDPLGAASFRIPVTGLAAGVTEANTSFPYGGGWEL